MLYSFGIFESLSKAKQYFGSELDASDFEKLKNIDKSKNFRDLPSIIYFYKNGENIDQLEKYFQLYNVFKNAIGSLEYIKNKDKVLLNSKPVSFLEFSEIIDKYNSRRIKKRLGDEKYEIDTELKPIWSNDRYEIYLANTQQKCIELGRGQTFCISRGDSSNMWPNYRKSDVATFYFIKDKHPNIPSEEIVVVDARQNNRHVLTDKRNSTGYKEFNIYLKENPQIAEVRHIFKNIPHSELELLTFNKDLNYEQFQNLSQETKDTYLSMGRKIDDEIWNSLNNNQKNVYINSGIWLINDRYKNLPENLKKRYEKLCWRKIENYFINHGSLPHSYDPIHMFLESQSVEQILNAEVSQKAKKESLKFQIDSNKISGKSDIESILSIIDVDKHLLQHIKGLNMNQMKMIAKHLKQKANLS